jgi:hypothetical protein
LDQRAKLSLAILTVGAIACGVVAARLGAEERPKDPNAPSPPSGRFLSDVATPDELKLWNSRGCVTCHGPEARGGPMGPDLTTVVPLYAAKHGDAATEALAAYLLDPKGSPKLRTDGTTYPNPMPSLEKLFGGRREEAPVIAAMLLRLAK